MLRRSAGRTLASTATAIAALAAVWVAPAALAGEGAVAITSAAVSCDDGSGNRYVDCGNGTVTDTQTGLVWLKNANCFGALRWQEAMTVVAGLASGDCGLSDGSRPGDWRLASLGEWQATVADAVLLSCVSPTLTDNTGALCLAAGVTSFTNIQSSVYWTASTVPATPGNARTITLVNGMPSLFAKTNVNFFWAVRYGQ